MEFFFTTNCQRVFDEFFLSKYKTHSHTLTIRNCQWTMNDEREKKKKIKHNLDNQMFEWMDTFWSKNDDDDDDSFILCPLFSKKIKE